MVVCVEGEKEAENICLDGADGYFEQKVTC